MAIALRGRLASQLIVAAWAILMAVAICRDRNYERLLWLAILAALARINL